MGTRRVFQAQIKDKIPTVIRWLWSSINFNAHNGRPPMKYRSQSRGIIAASHIGGFHSKGPNYLWIFNLKHFRRSQRIRLHSSTMVISTLSATIWQRRNWQKSRHRSCTPAMHLIGKAVRGNRVNRAIERRLVEDDQQLLLEMVIVCVPFSACNTFSINLLNHSKSHYFCVYRHSNK